MFKAVYNNYKKPPISSQINWSHPLSKGLVACFLCNEGNGTVVNNLANPSKNASVSVPSRNVWTGGKSGPALKFGTDGDFAGSTSLRLSTKRQNVTIAAIVYPFSTQAGMIFYIGDDDGAGGAGGYGIGVFANAGGSGGNIEVLFGGVRWLDSNKPVNLKQWNLLSATIRGGGGNVETTFFINGLMVAKNTNDTQPNVIDTGYSIGDELNDSKAVNGRRFLGLIDSCFLWERVMTDQEMYYLYREPYCFIVPK